jgi:heme A synthase
MKPVFYLSLLMAVLTLSLIALGGFVHNTGSSLACPDWPLCFGQVIPKMEGQVGIEHSHRLLATLIGMLSIALVFLTRRLRNEKPILYRVAWITLVVVILQGVLGGITVLLKLSPLVSTSHLGLSQIFFALILYMVLKSRPASWFSTRSETGKGASFEPPLFKRRLLLLGVALAALYVQIIWGAAIRHTGAGAACGLGPYYSVLCMNAVTEGLTGWPEQAPSLFHMLHRYLALVVGGLIIAATVPVMRWARQSGLRSLRNLALSSHIFLLIQIGLGVMTVWTYIGTASVTLHLVFAGLLFASVFSLNVLCREGFSLNSDKA